MNTYKIKWVELTPPQTFTTKAESYEEAYDEFMMFVGQQGITVEEDWLAEIEDTD